jgi:hypothetical protein
VGVAGEVTRLATPRDFAIRFPEVNAALGYTGCTPEEAMRLCHDLYKRHAEGVACGIQRAFTGVGVFNWQSFPAHSLLGVVQGRAALTRPQPAEDAQPEQGLVVDQEHLVVRFNGVACPLGNTLEFWFLERLHRTRGKYLSIEKLGEDVWDDATVLKNSVQRVVSSIRRLLRDAKITGVEIDGSQKGHYRLVVPSP